jgi:hypothetical protein
MEDWQRADIHGEYKSLELKVFHFVIYSGNIH